MEFELLRAFADGKIDRETMCRQKRQRFAGAGVAYRPDEYPAVMKQIRDAIETAALNNAIEGYVLSNEEIERLIREEIRAVLGPTFPNPP
jgi:ribonuclease D